MKTFPVVVPQFGAAPSVKVSIEYPTGTIIYSDSNKLLEIGQVVVSKRVDNYGEASSVTFTLDDSDGSIKTRIDNTNLVKIPVTVIFVLGVNEMAVLKGKLTGEVSWDESQRRVTLSAEGVTASETPPTTAALEDLPLGFGTPLKVKAVNIQKKPTGNHPGYSDQTATSYYIEGGTNFPQNTPINIDIWISNEPTIVNNGGSIQTFNNDSPLRMTGTMVGTTFTPTAKNIAVYTGLAIGTRDTSDPDNTDKSVMWLATDNAYIGGMWVKFDNSINYCRAQIGRKCFFWSPITPGYTVISEVAGTVRTSWGGQYTHPQYGISDNVDKWTIWPQATVVQAFADNTEIFAYNGIAGATVLKVYAKRSYNGETILAEVPSSYYTKDNAYSYGGVNRSVIKFTTPLNWRTHEKWSSDGIYVTAASVVGKNTVDQIQYIVEHYTTLSVDAVSFASVRTSVQYYPSNFVVKSSESPIKLIQDIAYQARIGVQIDAGTVKLRYLSKVPTTDLTITDDDIKLSSITLGFPNPDDLLTEIEYTWRQNYYDDAETYIYRNNINLYGLKTGQIPMSIYNDKTLVTKSADWIGNRRSNVWRKMKFKTMLNALGLETSDCIAMQSDSLSADVIRSDVDSVSLDLNEYTYEVGMTLASKSGTVNAENRPYEDLSYWQITELASMPAAPEAGLVETNFVVPLDPSKNEPNPNEGQKLKITINEDIVDGLEVSTVIRETTYVFTVAWLDHSDNLITNQSQPFTIELTDIGSDIFDATVGVPVVGTIGANGYGTAPFAVTGGTGEITRKLKFGWGSKTNGLYGNSTLHIMPEPTPKWLVWPSGVERDELFDVSISDMLPSTTYNVTLVGPSDDDLADNTAAVTTITSDGSGQYTGQWKFTGGTHAVTDCSVVLEHSLYEYSSPVVVIISTGSSNLVYKHSGVLTLGTAVAAPSWTPATSASNTIGVVAKVTATDSYIVVRGLVCLTGLTDEAKYYVTAGGILDTVDTGAYVLKCYLNDLCWVGGGSDAGKLEKLKDVTLTSPTNKDLLVYNGTKWVNKTVLASIDTNLLPYDRLAQLPTLSILGNGGVSTGNVAAITSSTVGAVLMHKDSVVKFELIKNANIDAAAAISHTKIDFAGWAPPVGGGTQAANTIYAGPTSGAAASPSFRALVAADIPSLDWSKIGSGKPTTLAGYGITDGALNTVSHSAGTGLSGTAYNGTANQTWSVSYGTGAGTACQGNDARLSDARTPIAHNQAWSTITSRPTTLSGYGITDALTIVGTPATDWDLVSWSVSGGAWYVDPGVTAADQVVISDSDGFTGLAGTAGTILTKPSTGNLVFSKAVELGTATAGSASLKVFQKTNTNHYIELGANNIQKVNANGTYTALTVKTFTTSTTAPAYAGELGDVHIVY